MKSITMKQLVLTSAMMFGALAAQSRVADARTQCPDPGPNQVTLHDGVLFGGSCQVLNLRPDGLPTGYRGSNGPSVNLNLPSLFDYYNWDVLFAVNSISSVKVGTGVYLTLFADRPYAGNYVHLNTGFYPFLGSMDDQTESLRITPTDRDCRKRADGTFKTALGRGEIAIYKDSSYGGDCVQWRFSDNFVSTVPSLTIPWNVNAVVGVITAMWGPGLFEPASAASIRVGPYTAARLCRAEGNKYDPSDSRYYCETFDVDQWRLANTAFGEDKLNSLTITSTAPRRGSTPVF